MLHRGAAAEEAREALERAGRAGRPRGAQHAAHELLGETTEAALLAEARVQEHREGEDMLGREGVVVETDARR